jgi:hypothetical protein
MRLWNVLTIRIPVVDDSVFVVVAATGRCVGSYAHRKLQYTDGIVAFVGACESRA